MHLPADGETRAQQHNTEGGTEPGVEAGAGQRAARGG
jgi:hypothetical protein